MTRANFIESTLHALEAASEWVGRTVAWLTLLMVIVSFAVVVLRYAFAVGSIAVQESVTYMHALVFMLGAAFTLKHGGHVRVDIVYRGLGSRGKAWVDLLGMLLLLLPTALFILWSSWGYVADSWALHEGSREAGGIPLVYLLKSAIPLMAALLVIQGLAQGLRSVLILSGRSDALAVPGAEHETGAEHEL